MTVFWRDDLKIDKKFYTDFTIELLIVNTDRKFSWWCVCVYTNVDDTIREFQWDTITQRKQIWGMTWILVEDMNDIASNKKKWGGNSRPESSFRVFRNFINKNQLIDMGFEGVPWTWCNN